MVGFGATNQLQTESLVKRAESIYFIQCNGARGPIKIGKAVDPNRRLSELRIGCPYPMTLLASSVAEDADLEERRLHMVFAHLRIHGEWFECATELLSAVDENRRDAREAARFIAELAGSPQGTVRRAFVQQRARRATP